MSYHFIVFWSEIEERVCIVVFSILVLVPQQLKLIDWKITQKIPLEEVEHATMIFAQ